MSLSGAARVCAVCAHLPICSQCFATALQYVDLPDPAGPITICPCLPIATRVRYERMWVRMASASGGVDARCGAAGERVGRWMRRVRLVCLQVRRAEHAHV